MNWTIIGFPTFLKDMESLPSNTREQVARFVDVELPSLTNPFSSGKLRKLKGGRDYYKVRFGNFRLGLRVDQKAKLIEIRRVLPRRDMYRHFP